MSDIIVFSASDGSVIIRHPALGHDASMFAAETPAGTSAIVADHTDLPRQSAFRAAWRWVSGAVAVDLPAARALRTAALVSMAAELSARIDTLALSHLVDGSAAEVAALRALKASLSRDAKMDLSEITDLDALAVFEPASFAAARAALTN